MFKRLLFKKLRERIGLIFIPVSIAIGLFANLKVYPYFFIPIILLFTLVVLETLIETIKYTISHKICIEKVDDEFQFREILKFGRDNYEAIGNDYPPDEGPVSWWKKNNTGVYILSTCSNNCKTHRVFFAAYPVTEEFYLSMLSQELREDDLCPKYIINKGERAKYWYVGDIGRMQKQKRSNAFMLRIFTSYLIRKVFFELKKNNSLDKDGIIAFGFNASPIGKNLLEGFHFIQYKTAIKNDNYVNEYHMYSREIAINDLMKASKINIFELKKLVDLLKIENNTEKKAQFKKKIDEYFNFLKTKKGFGV